MKPQVSGGAANRRMEPAGRGAQAYSRLSVRIVGGVTFRGQHTSGEVLLQVNPIWLGFGDRSGKGEFNGCAQFSDAIGPMRQVSMLRQGVACIGPIRRQVQASVRLASSARRRHVKPGGALTGGET